MKAVRTRIAPSPTGEDLHIGNAYTALINWIFARQQAGKFIIRIEDTDRSRLVSGSEKRILSSLAWLGIVHDEGPDKDGPFAPYRQSDRLPLYQKHAQELVKNGHAYYCFCTQERLEKMRKTQEDNHKPPMYDGTCKKLDPSKAQTRVAKGESHVVRLNVPDKGTTTFRDIIRGDISFENKLLDDQVILKSDGYPTYHLGVVVDDHVMEISHIIRGEEWISSTPKHILLYKFFGWVPPVFAHMPLLRNPDKSKLSKRKNPVWASWYREQGFLPEAVVNYLGTLAWAFPEGREIFTVEEMVDKFKLEDVQTTAPIFDTEKLRWMNGEYIRKAEISNFKFQISNFYKGTYDTKKIEQVWPLVRDRMKTLAEFESLAGFFFAKPPSIERKLNAKILTSLKDTLRGCNWTHEAMEKAIRDAAEKERGKAKDYFMELRIAVTGKSVGPPILESLEILGKQETLSRLT